MLRLLSLWCLVGLIAVGAEEANQRSAVTEIDSLVSFVGRQSGIAFIRNSTAHDAAEAERHLRLKWRRAGTRVKTAEDFIKYCATRSSFTGTPYRVRFSDGTIKTSEEVLLAQLRHLRGQTSQ
jgi:hypothetical protein